MISCDKRLLDQRRADIIAALESADYAQVGTLIDRSLSDADIAHLLESIPASLRHILWNSIEETHQGQILTHLNEDIQQSFLSGMTAEELLETLQDIASDDVADLLQQAPEPVADRVLELMPAEERVNVAGLLAFPEDTAGGLMNTDMITIRADVTIETVLRYLRKIKLPEPLDVLWVTDREQHYRGTLAISQLLQTAPEVAVSSVMLQHIEPIHVDEPKERVAKLFERHDLVSAPVVDGTGLLVGRITIDDVVDVIIDSADHTMLSMAGLDEDNDLFAPVLRSSRARAIWLGINMATAFVAATVMSRFEGALSQIVALAVLSPIVASMGGIAGSQTLTLVIRGMATEHITLSNLSWMTSRELGVGLINGSLWATVIGVVTALWYGNLSLALVIAAAILANICLAVLAGALLPFSLKALKIDPALSGGVILTTLTDTFGFLTFLGLATVFLL